MFDGDIVKKKFPLKKIIDVEMFWPRQSPKQSQRQSWTYKMFTKFVFWKKP